MEWHCYRKLASKMLEAILSTLHCGVTFHYLDLKAFDFVSHSMKRKRDSC